MIKVVGSLCLIAILATSAQSRAGDAGAGETRYYQSCHACHGPAGKGVASYPKISGNSIEYTREKLNAYRAGEKVGPNSALMIMMAKPLTDDEIDNLSTYLKDAKYE
ncbi:c-type cytochrome [Litorivicinus lipolyticus]|uniref:c-type cytochrome n=1 Tax=Litorivicinus lipolyticus TaxID=418701 RepID=UPI003B5B4404